jgi:hypothetical protein
MSDIDTGLKLNLRYASARFFLGVLATDQVLRTIETAMNTGLWRDEFLGLIGCEPIFREVEQPFARCLDALGVTMTCLKEAILVIVDYHTRAIVEGAELDELNDLFDRDFKKFDFDLSWDKRLLESADAATLWELYHAYCGIQFQDDENAYRAVQERVRDEASRWQSTYGK